MAYLLLSTIIIALIWVVIGYFMFKDINVTIEEKKDEKK